MREIKFRIWDKEELKFIKTECDSFELMISLDGKFMTGITYEGYGEAMYPEKYILMQYTGLQDSHGAEIYEGDILKVDDYCKVVVNFESGAFHGDGKIISDFLYGYVQENSCEVIGNKFENPELVKLIIK